MPTPIVRAPESYLAVSLSADGLVKTGEGFAWGVFVTASAAGVIRFYDNTAASGTVILDQYPVIASEFVPLPVQFTNGLYFDLVSGSATVTIYYI
jgi:preprotein translocase subunit Sec61beta